MASSSDLKDAIKAEAEQEAQTRKLAATDILSERVAQRDSKISGLEATVRRITKERDEQARALSMTGRISSKLIKPPVWATKRASTKDEHHAIPELFLSDMHFDEVVDPEEMDWCNAYNRKIALTRLHSTVDTAIELCREYYSGLKYDGFDIIWGGDSFSGEIHEEITQTNEDTLLASVDFWMDEMAAVVERFASEFGQVRNLCTFGNHPRLTKKMQSKKRAKTNMEWFCFQRLAKQMAGPNCVWQVPLAAHTQFKTYGVTYRLVHGNDFTGGDGITGALRPVIMGSQRVTRRAQNQGQPYDVLLVGHWHQYNMLPAKGVIINGAMKGYDEYASSRNFEPEPATQAFWLTTPEHGITFASPIVCEDRKGEGW